jgi:hypothetical protein
MSIHPLHPITDRTPFLAASTWQQRLDSARSVAELVDVGRDFLASFDPFELHALPEHCRPPAKLIDADINAYAFDLVRHECATPETEELVHKLARFFSHAATRLAQLTARNQDADDYDEQQSA